MAAATGKTSSTATKRKSKADNSDREIYTTREEWLQDLVGRITEWYPALPPVRVSVGFTSKGIRSNRIGECWDKANGDGACHIFIHPKMVDPVDVAQVVAHELIHAALGCEAKHGPDFKRLAHKIGLEGKMTATVAGPAFKEAIAPILKQVGMYPHGALKAGVGSNGPKQSTRMLKIGCPMCGYTARTTQKWLDVGLPVCPCGEEMLQG